MPERKTIRRAQAAKRAGKSPSTQASEFVRESIEHIRKGKHGARSTKQAIAIGLSQARRAGVKLPAKGAGAKSKTPRSKRGDSHIHQPATNPRRARASARALRREGRSAVSSKALARQARQQAAKRTPAQRSAIARKAARTRARHAS